MHETSLRNARETRNGKCHEGHNPPCPISPRRSKIEKAAELDRIVEGNPDEDVVQQVLHSGHAREHNPIVKPKLSHLVVLTLNRLERLESWNTGNPPTCRRCDPRTHRARKPCEPKPRLNPPPFHSNHCAALLCVACTMFLRVWPSCCKPCPAQSRMT